MKKAALVFCILSTLLGGLWLLQGLGIVHVRPILCFADCAAIQGPSPTWAVIGAVTLVISGLVICLSLQRPHNVQQSGFSGDDSEKNGHESRSNLTLLLKLVFWTCFLAAVIVYVTMLTWTLPAITKSAGGNLPFDLRPMGYDVDDAKMFLNALMPDGRQLYLNTQQKLDTAYPALMAITLGLGFYLLAPNTWKFGRWIGAVLSSAGALFDYTENHYVVRMLEWNAQTFEPELVQAASRVSILKSICTTIAILAFFVMLARWLYRRWTATRIAKNGSPKPH
jgi:Ca2+/Na+ antiporter